MKDFANARSKLEPKHVNITEGNTYMYCYDYDILILQVMILQLHVTGGLHVLMKLLTASVQQETPMHLHG